MGMVFLGRHIVIVNVWFGVLPGKFYENCKRGKNWQNTEQSKNSLCRPGGPCAERIAVGLYIFRRDLPKYRISYLYSRIPL